jgi:hypothetical protein
MAIESALELGLQALSLILLGGGIVELAIQGLGAASIDASADVCAGADLDSTLIPGVSVVSVTPPALKFARSHVRRLLHLQFTNLAEIVIVIQDPPDEDIAIWIEEFGLSCSPCPPASGLEAHSIQQVYESKGLVRLVVCRASCRYEDELNAGLIAAKAAWVAVMNPGTCFSQNVLKRLIGPVLLNPEPVAAVGALAQAPASQSSWSGRLFRPSPRRAWLGRCAAASIFNVFVPAPGDCFLFSRNPVLQLKGFRRGLAETIMQLHRGAFTSGLPHAIAFLPERTCRQELREFTGGDICAATGAQAPSEASRWLILRRDSLSWLVALAPYYLRFAPIAKMAGLALGTVGFLAGRVSLPSLGLLLAATIVIEALLSLTAIVLCDPISDSEAAARDIASC